MMKAVRMMIKKLKVDGFLLAAMGAGLLFRILVWKTMRLMISFDEANYLRLAAHAVEAGFPALLHPYWSPFYPVFVWLFSSAPDKVEITGRLINILAGTALIPLMYTWARMLLGLTQARWSAFFTAFYPSLAFDQTMAMPEPLYMLTAFAGLLSGWRAIHHRSWKAGLSAGLLWACTYLSKPEGAGFLLVFVGFTAGIQLFTRGRNGSRNLFPILAASIMGFLMVASFYLIYLRHTTGQWTISTKGMLNQQMEAAVNFNDGPVKDPFFRLTSDNEYLPYDMGMHFGNFHDLKRISEGKARIVHISASRLLLKYGRNINELIQNTLPQLFGLFLLIPLIIGAFSPNVRYQETGWLYLLSFIAFYYFLVVPLFHITPRYLMPLFPLFFIWISEGGLVLWHRVRLLPGGKRRGLLKTALFRFSLFLLLGVGIFGPRLIQLINQNQAGAELWDPPLELKKAALWLRNQTAETPVLMTLNKAIDFYAGQYDVRLGASYSYDSIDRNIAYAKNRHCGYLVFSSRYLPWFENLQPLVGSSDPPGISRIYDESDDQGIRTVIYQINEPVQ
jgi:4-amino-4-deoxy-L-arabinose transferase-like glycosyltransferase